MVVVEAERGSKGLECTSLGLKKSHRSILSNKTHISGSGAVQEVLLKLCHDVLAIGVLPQDGDVGPDLVHEDLALAGLCHIYHLLDHVVGILVLHHDMQG